MMRLFDHNKLINILARHVDARPIPRTESGMISFFSLYFFIYCPSRFEVDFMSIFPTSGEVNDSKSSTEVDLTTLKVGVEADYIGTGDVPTSPRLGLYF